MWLRTPGHDMQCAAYMTSAGNVLLYGNDVTDDSLSVRLNKSVLMDLWLEPVDTGRVVCMRKTYQVADRLQQVVDERFSLQWQPISKKTTVSTLLRRDEEIKKKPHF